MPRSPAGGGSALGALADAAREPRVVDADLRVLDRRRRLGGAAQRAARPVGVAVDQQRTMLATLSSEPASQYCRVRK